MTRKKIVRFILAVVFALLLPLPLVTQAELVEPLVKPDCDVETRFYRITLRHALDENGIWIHSWYEFTVRWYVDGKPYDVLSPSWVEVGGSLTYDADTRLWKLKWEKEDSTICVTAPNFSELITPFGYKYWRTQQEYTQWFQTTYPTLKMTEVATSPTSTPAVGG